MARRRAAPLFGVLILLAFAAASVCAEEPQVKLASLIEKLGSDSFSERTEATETLASLGAGSREPLEAALRHPQAEVRLRAKELLRRIRLDAMWSASPVEWSQPNSPASAVLAALAKQSGNRLLTGDQYGSFHDATIECTGLSGGFWQVLDETCGRSGNRVRPHYDTRQPGLVVVGGSPCRYPTTYAGPLRAQITAARRLFSEEVDYEDLASEVAHTFQLNLQVMWEDRFRLVAYRSQIEVEQAITDAGSPLPATSGSGGGWNVVSGGTRQVSMTLRLHPPPSAAEKLDVLALSWGLVAVGDMATLEVKDLSSREPHYQDDVELVVEDATSGPGSRCDVTLKLIRDLVIPDPPEILFQENEIELLDAAGRPFRNQGQSTSLDEDGARLKLTFAGESSESVPTTLRFRYPRLRSERNLPIVFRDVPLPNARPE